MHKSTTHRVKNSMISMLIMRPISAIAGLLILILLSRFLTPSDYGNFFAIWAIVEILILASNLGLIHAVYRYVSAAEYSTGVISTNGPVWKFIWWRFCTLALAGYILSFFPESLANLTNQPLFTKQILSCIVLIIFFEGLARFFETIFDTMLCQGRSQISLVSRTVFRLAGYLIVLSQDSLDLQHVLFVDVISTCLGAIIAAAMLFMLSRKAKLSGQNEQKENIGFGRMTRYALPAFLAQVLTLVYGPDALKIVLSSTSGTTALASFGFAYSLAAVVQRYIPANLLGGIFRPIFVLGANKPNADQVLSQLLSISIKINWLVILPIFCFLYFAGSPLLANLSGGNYLDAGITISIIMLGLLAISMHLTFSMYCLARELSWPLLYATLFSTVGLPLGIIMAEHYGAVGIAITFGVSELIWSIICFAILKHRSHGELTLDWFGFIKLLVITMAAIIICSLLEPLWGRGWVTPAILAPFLFVVGIYVSRLFSIQEQTWLISVLPSHKGMRIGEEKC